MIARSAIILSTKNGIVYFVGKAARFVTRTMTIDNMAIPNGMIATPAPVNIIAIIVKGVMIQPCDTRAKPTQNNRSFSWALHQLKNLVMKEVFDKLAG